MPDRPRILPRLFPLLLAALLAAPLHAGLRDEVDRIIRATDLGGATVAVSIIEAGPGTPILEIEADRLMTPASNMKLLTTGAALHALGADFTFRTHLVRDGDRLVVTGDGDPAFGDPVLLETMGADGSELTVDQFLDLWVRPVVASGLKRVAELVIDDGIFDRDFVHPTWPIDQLNRRYCAQVAGLNFHLNVLHYFPRPTAGRPDIGDVIPDAFWLAPKNNATSNAGANDRDSVWIARRPDGNELTFYGNVKHVYRSPVPVTVHDMPSLFGRLLAERLAASGVQVGAVRRVRPGETLTRASTDGFVAPVVRTPLTTAITRCNRDSQNLYAESILKRTGHALTGQPGSWLNGTAIVRHVVHERLGNPALAARLVVADGSGLSRDNRVAPGTMTAWLNGFHNDAELGGAFLASLAVGGESGTMKRRLGTGQADGMVVQAKSGYIDGVSCLSGYVTGPTGQRRCFSVMVNGLKAPVSRAKGLQDRIVRAVAEDMAEELAEAALGLGSD